MGLMTVFTALNYSELGAAIPLAGGGYSFTHRTLPRPLAFFIGIPSSHSGSPSGFSSASLSSGSGAQLAGVRLGGGVRAGDAAA